ncbi:MAG: hypothetical protein ABIO21_15045, partial [Pseudomonas sp.]
PAPTGISASSQVLQRAQKTRHIGRNAVHLRETGAYPEMGKRRFSWTSPQHRKAKTFGQRLK